MDIPAFAAASTSAGYDAGRHHGPFTVRTDKARKELGYSPRITSKEGIAEMTRT